LEDPVVPKKEDFKPECASPYAQTKLDGEFYLKHFNDKIKTISLRYFNVFLFFKKKR
jgi:UDP-glucose 4-epimerase